MDAEIGKIYASPPAFCGIRGDSDYFRPIVKEKNRNNTRLSDDLGKMGCVARIDFFFIILSHC